MQKITKLSRIYAGFAFGWLLFFQALLAIALIWTPDVYSGYREIPDFVERWLIGSWLLALAGLGLVIIFGIVLLTVFVRQKANLNPTDSGMCTLSLAAGMVCIGAAMVSWDWLTPQAEQVFPVSESIQRVVVMAVTDAILLIAFIIRERKSRRELIS